MKGPPTSARTVAADVVRRVLDDGAWTQPALSAALSASGLDARDKAFATELAYGTLRWSTSLEKSLLRGADKPGRGLDKRMRPHLLVAAYQVQHLADRVPARAAVSEAVNAVRSVRPGLDGFANALLRKLGSPLHEMLPPDASVDDVADALGVPRVLASSIAQHVPRAELRAALAALNARPSTYAYAIADKDAELVAHRFVPRVFALDGGSVGATPGFREGAYVVVDPGSALVALLVAAGLPSGARVIDLCAAPGGKAAIVASTGARVIAVDRSAERAEKIRENGKRVHVEHKLDVVVADALEAKLEGADAVLLDAPCTGFGTTRRKPEIKLRRTAADVETDAQLQRALLMRAAALVKPGGVLVYSVCSPVDAEGVDQVKALLAKGGFGIENATVACPWLPADALEDGCVRLYPHRHDADAFFCARLRRV